MTKYAKDYYLGEYGYDQLEKALNYARNKQAKVVRAGRNYMFDFGYPESFKGENKRSVARRYLYAIVEYTHGGALDYICLFASNDNHKARKFKAIAQIHEIKLKNHLEMEGEFQGMDPMLEGKLFPGSKERIEIANQGMYV